MQNISENTGKSQLQRDKKNRQAVKKNPATKRAAQLDTSAEMAKSVQPQTAEQKFIVSRFDNKTDTRAKNLRGTWETFCEWFSNPAIRKDKDGELFSPATFKGNQRSKVNAVELSMLVLDFDHGLNLEYADSLSRELGVPYAIWTTWSHQRKTDKHPTPEDCFRIVFPLREPISADDVPYLFDWANARFFFKADKACKDAGRMFYLPVKFSRSSPYEHYSKTDGEFLDWRPIVEAAKQAEAKTKADAEEKAERIGREGLSPFDDYAERGDIRPLLEEAKWEYLADDGEGEQWRRPGKRDAGFSAHLFHESGLFHVFSDNAAPFEANQTYTKPQVYALLKHGGDESEAARALMAQGFGQRPKSNGGGLRTHDKPKADAIEVLGGKYKLHPELILEGRDKGKLNLIARDADGGMLHQDIINIAKADERDAFIKALALDLNDAGRKEFKQKLLMLSENPPPPHDAAPVKAAEERVMSKVLSDGRIVEQLAGQKFALYDPTNDTITYIEEIEDNGVTYKPAEDVGVSFLPEKLTEYGTEADLDKRIEDVYRRYCDASDGEMKKAVKYVRMSYVVDFLNELPYLKVIGEPGSGKSRFCAVGVLMSYRPLIATGVTGAVLFRLMDRFKPTLFIDEFNINAQGEDVEAIMQVLNTGFQRLAKVPRTRDSDAQGERKIEFFSTFGAKFLAGLKSSGSEALESRCIEVRLVKTARTDIPFQTTDEMLKECAETAEMLYLWRLRFLSKGKEAFRPTLLAAEADLKRHEVDPRFIQISTPLYALIEDDQLKKDFIESLEKRTQITRADRLDGFYGKIVKAVYDLIFDDSGDKVKQKTLYEVGEPIYEASTKDISGLLLERYKDMDDMTDAKVGHKLTELGFTKEKLKSRKYDRPEGNKRNRTAVVYEPEMLRIFVNYGLPLPGDVVPQATQPKLVEIGDQTPFNLEDHPEPTGRRRGATIG